MLKVSALILLLATLGYLAETVRVSFTMANMPETPACCKGKTCASDAGKGSLPGKCNQDGSCNSTACCDNCPLCYVATTVASPSVSVPYTLCSPEYPVISAGKLMDYPSRSWKPPSGIL